VAYITLDAKKFNAYLEEEGLEHVLAERKKKKESDQPGRERYRRNLKCLLHVGGVTDDTWQKTFQQKLEIVLLADPATLQPGAMLPLRVLFEGKPLPTAPLFAYGKSKKGITKQQLKTDQNGNATMRLEHAGPWLVRLVHMRRCAGDPKADWESFWAACSFGLK
jgi:uncharacterized GH25 family protein